MDPQLASYLNTIIQLLVQISSRPHLATVDLARSEAPYISMDAIQFRKSLVPSKPELLHMTPVIARVAVTSTAPDVIFVSPVGVPCNQWMQVATRYIANAKQLGSLPCPDSGMTFPVFELTFINQ